MKPQGILTTNSWASLVIHNSFISDVYLENISDMKYQLYISTSVDIYFGAGKIINIQRYLILSTTKLKFTTINKKYFRYLC